MEKTLKHIDGNQFSVKRNERGQFIKGNKSGWGFEKGHQPWNKNKHLSVEIRAKIGKANKGKQHSKKQRRMTSERMKGKTGNKAANWKGGRMYSSHGYVLIYSPNHPYANTDGYVYEHRLIAEQVIQRFLKKNEVVHHINMIRDDNRKSNLFICLHGYHIWLHYQIKRRIKNDK